MAPAWLSNLRRRSTGAVDRLDTDDWQGEPWADDGLHALIDGEEDEGPKWDWLDAQRGFRLRTLILLRWVSIAGQTAAVLATALLIRFHMPLTACLGVIGVAAWANLTVGLALPGARMVSGREAVLQLGFDIVELTLLLMLTGGVENPFSLLLMAPVVVAAAALPTRSAIILGALALTATAVIVFWHAPLPWRGAPFVLPPFYTLGLGIATAVGITFTAAYAWQAQAEAHRMELALTATQSVLAREQRLSALGGLAAAAAHELGTPLATIQVVTKEMIRGLDPTTPLHEDVSLLISQAERCRQILKQLSQSPDASDARHARMSLSQLLDEISDDHGGGSIFINREVHCAVGAAILEVSRQPEVLHGLSAFVENASDFAESMVEVTAFYDADRLTITVRDDGPGFSADVMAKLGEPYVTTRSQGENSRSGHLGMGLGFFIAKTLLERSGARVEFRNARRGGAVVQARWPRPRIEAKAEV